MLTVGDIELEQRTAEYIEHVRDAARNATEGKVLMYGRKNGAVLHVREGRATLKFSIED